MFNYENEIERKGTTVSQAMSYVNIFKDSSTLQHGNENRCVELDFPFHLGFDYAFLQSDKHIERRQGCSMRGNIERWHGYEKGKEWKRMK